MKRIATHEFWLHAVCVLSLGLAILLGASACVCLLAIGGCEFHDDSAVDGIDANALRQSGWRVYDMKNLAAASREAERLKAELLSDQYGHPDQAKMVFAVRRTKHETEVLFSAKIPRP